jgi:cell division protease FtsH
LAAEAEVFGDDETSTGSSNDIQQVTNLARQMVTLYGMSELGPMALESMDNQVFLGRNLMPRNEVSEEMAHRIDNKVREIALSCFSQARQVLRQNRSLMDHLVDLLLERETVEGQEFRQIVRQYVDIPEKTAPAPVKLVSL